MKKFVKSVLLFQTIILSLVLGRSFVVTTPVVQIFTVSDHEPEILLPDNLVLFCVLPENGPCQSHGNNYSYIFKKSLKALITATSGFVGNNCLSVQYFENYRQFSISLSISMIIFPFNYFW